MGGGGGGQGGCELRSEAFVKIKKKNWGGGGRVGGEGVQGGCKWRSGMRQQYFSGLGLQLTVDILLNGNPNENVSVNNNIFRRVQLYILATKRFA